MSFFDDDDARRRARTREEAEREREALIGQGSGLARQTSLGLWAADSQRARQAPLTDPRNFERIEEMLEGLSQGAQETSSEGGGELSRGSLELSTAREPAIAAQEATERLSGEISALQSSLTGVTSPAERQKIEGRLATLNEDLAAAQQVIGDYAAKAEPFVKLQTAMQLAALVENTSAEEAHDALFSLAKAIKDGVIDGGIAGGLTGILGGPGGAAVGAASGALVGGVGSGLAAFVLGGFLNPKELEALPQMLKDDPEAAITLLEKVEGIESLVSVAQVVLGGLQVAPKLAYSVTDAAVGGMVSHLRDAAKE